MYLYARGRGDRAPMQSKDKPTCSTDWTNSDGFSKTAASRAFNHYSYHTASAPKVTVLILLPLLFTVGATEAEACGEMHPCWRWMRDTSVARGSSRRQFCKERVFSACESNSPSLRIAAYNQPNLEQRRNRLMFVCTEQASRGHGC